ncbi:hypothetical protein D3C78_1053750 [compost metagenome]
MIDEHTVAFVRDVERYIFVRLLRASTAVLIPQIDDLTIADKWRETLAEAIYPLANTNIKLLAHEGVAIVFFNVCHRFLRASGNPLAIAQEVNRPFRALANAYAEASACKNRFVLIFFNDNMVARL